MMTLDQAKAGTMVRCTGFTCISEGAVVAIQIDEEGFPFLACDQGGHWLNGCVGENNVLIGIEQIG